MDTAETQWMTYRRALEWSRSAAVRLAEVPLEHAVSLPLPTRRRGVAAYVQFAAPALRIPDQGVVQDAPDRWWLLAARGGYLLAYALVASIDLVPQQTFGRSELAPATDSVAQRRAALAAFSAAMESAAVDFFDGRAATAQQQEALQQLLRAVVPDALLAQHRAYAPDFFSWTGF